MPGIATGGSLSSIPADRSDQTVPIPLSLSPCIPHNVPTGRRFLHFEILASVYSGYIGGSTGPKKRGVAKRSICRLYLYELVGELLDVDEKEDVGEGM
jgi:hypothetical protein